MCTVHIAPEQFAVRLWSKCSSGPTSELTQVLVRIDQQEFINLDEVLLELKMTPDILELPIPRFFIEERQAELQEREKLLVRSGSAVGLV